MAGGPSTPAASSPAAQRATRSSSGPRRSGRDRKKAGSYYAEAAEQIRLSQSPATAKKSSNTPRSSRSGSRSASPRKRGGRSASPRKRGGSSSAKKRILKDAEDDDDAPSDAEQSAHSSENESSSESGSDDDDDFGATATKRKRTPAKKDPNRKKSTVRTGRSPAVAKASKVSATKSPKQKRRAPAKRRATAKTAAQRAAHHALATLAKNVLPAGEAPGLSSLVAGLLYSYRPTRESIELGDLVQKSEYTSNLVALSKKVIGVSCDHPNRAQCALLNLIFRSVGGSEETDLSLGLDKNNKANGAGKKEKKKKSKSKEDGSDEDMSEVEDMDTDAEEEEEEEGDEEVILDEMDTDEWARVVTDLVDDMRHVPANQILICADPLGAVHQAHELTEREKKAKGENAGNMDTDIGKTDKKKDHVSLGAIEYRKIYQEFWYVLGHVALTEGGMATTKSNEFNTSQDSDDDDDDDNSKDSNKDASIVRLDAELAKTLLLRVIELSPVGQPDVRAAATLAALSISHAVLDRSAMLVKKLDVATRQYEAARKGAKSPRKEGAKAEALKVRMESLKRSVEDLEEVVQGPVVQGLFVHRYRDSNEHVRAMCLTSLSRFTLQRPDLFLTDKYLKYFGWMTHDKHPDVRCAAIKGLLAPFDAVRDSADGNKANKVGDVDYGMIDKIDLGALEHVVAKFLPRIVEAVMDPVGEVQQAAMALMLSLLKDGFLDEVQDDKLWDQTNQRSLAVDAPASVQKDALYFILEQLEAFDDGGENTKAQPNERKRAQQLDAVASYAAHTLTNGAVPLDKIRVGVADLLVKSLREMPEHRGLVTDWSAMLRAIKEDHQAATAHHVTAGDRANVAKQRVLVRMLACAAREEVAAVADAEFLQKGTDPDAVEVTPANKQKNGSKGKKGPNMGREHENLSIALLKALPNLLIQFKGDLAIIPELASLPRFLIPTVFSLPQRKNDFMALIKNLGEIYLSSSDDRILDSAARSLVSLCNGDHARVAESKAQLRKVAAELRDRVVELMSADDATIATSAFSANGLLGDRESDFTSVKSKRRSARKKTPGTASSPGSDKTSLTDERTAADAPDADSEYAIYLNLKRLKILSKKTDLSAFFDGDDVNQLELLCNFVSDNLKSRLRASKPIDLRENADEETTVAKVIDGPDVLSAIGKGVREGLEFLLCVIAWFTNSTMISENLIVEDDDLIDNAPEEEDDATVTDHVVLRLRTRLLSILELCFAQFIPPSERESDEESTVAQHSEEQHSFADFVQLAAGKVTSDLRTLFPKEYGDAASPLLRSFSLQEDGRLIGAYVRFLDSKEHLLRENDPSNKSAGAAIITPSAAERNTSQSLLYPMGRATATNWTHGNRREAGVFLRHIASSGPTASAIVAATSRQMKKIDPVRMLESQMASLRQSYENWVDETPELESDRPSEDEMGEFEEAERRHQEEFGRLEQRASQFSQTLGVFGKFSSAKLGPALNGFVREGIRFSFSNLDDNGEDTLVLGSRLSFLLLLAKYANWIKRNRKHKAEIQEYADGLELQMRDHEEFEEVHADDSESLATFRQVLGLKALPPPVMSAGASVVSARSYRSGRSKASTRSFRSGDASARSFKSGASVASARSYKSGASVASARSYKSGASVASARSYKSGASVASARSYKSGASVASSRLSRGNGEDDDNSSIDSLGDLPSPAASTSNKSLESRASRVSRLSSTLPTLLEGEKEESPQDDDASESDTHFSASPGNSLGNMTDMTPGLSLAATTPGGTTLGGSPAETTPGGSSLAATTPGGNSLAETTPGGSSLAATTPGGNSLTETTPGGLSSANSGKRSQTQMTYENSDSEHSDDSRSHSGEEESDASSVSPIKASRQSKRRRG